MFLALVKFLRNVGSDAVGVVRKIFLLITPSHSFVSKMLSGLFLRPSLVVHKGIIIVPGLVLLIGKLLPAFCSTLHC